MRNFAIHLAVLCASLALPARAEMPSWWTALHGAYLEEDVTPEPVVLPPTDIKYLPKYVMSIGGGAIIPGSGPGKFAYDSASIYVGQGTYATVANEYTMTQNKVEACPLAGGSKILYQFGPLSIGTTGLAGACSNAPAGVIQGFGSFHFGKSAWSAILTVTKPFTSGLSQAVKVSAGVQWAGN